MTKEREYRAYAGTCVDLANKATNLSLFGIPTNWGCGEKIGVGV
jgi:hypothetical protein